MYAKALRGELQQFTGISDPYEEPLAPDVVVETSVDPPPMSVQRIMAAIGWTEY
jgi:adenylylsulfate kinase-like enzyme